MEFLTNFLGAILGTGVGGTIIYLASQKFIENTTKSKFDNIDKDIKDLKSDNEKRFKEFEDNKVSVSTFEDFKKEDRQKFQDFKNDYVPLKVYETSQKYLNEGIKEIKEMIRLLTEKIDRVK